MEFRGFGEIAEASREYNKGSVERMDETVFEPELLDKYDSLMEGYATGEGTEEGDIREVDGKEENVKEKESFWMNWKRSWINCLKRKISRRNRRKKAQRKTPGDRKNRMHQITGKKRKILLKVVKMVRKRD